MIYAPKKRLNHQWMVGLFIGVGWRMLLLKELLFRKKTLNFINIFFFSYLIRLLYP